MTKKNTKPQSTTEKDYNENMESDQDAIRSDDSILEIKTENEKLKNEYEDQILRLKAENDNLGKRYEKQISEARAFSITNFATDLLGVMDNMIRALSFVPEEIDNQTKNIIMGVEMTQKEMENVFARYGISVIDPKKGDVFDHNVQQAVSRVTSDEHKPGTVVDVLQVGYKLKDRLLRPASVTVAKEDDGQ